MENNIMNAGYEIIYVSQIDRDVAIVLGRNPVSKMYVTWRYADNYGYYWGHYFEHEEDALEDLADRIRKERKHG